MKCYFLLIIRYYDIKTQKIVFYSFDDPINYLLLTEYDIITEITNQKSKKMNLNNFIENLKNNIVK